MFCPLEITCLGTFVYKPPLRRMSKLVIIVIVSYSKKPACKKLVV